MSELIRTCGLKGCDNTALMALGDRWLCGHCVKDWHDMKQNSIAKELEELENARKDLS